MERPQCRRTTIPFSWLLIAIVVAVFSGAGALVSHAIITVSGSSITGDSAFDAFTVPGTPPASSSSQLLELGPNAISNGSPSGTDIGINPTNFSGDFLDFQVNSSTAFKVDNSGNVTVSTIKFPDGTTETSAVVNSGPSSAYTFSVSNGTVTATPNAPGLPSFSGTDAAVVINEAINAVGSTCGTMYFKNGTYNINSLANLGTYGYSTWYAAIVIPAMSSSGQFCQWLFVGESAPTWPGEVGSAIQNGGVILNVTPAAVTSAGAGSNSIFGFWQAPASPAFPLVYDEFENLGIRFPSNQRGNETAFSLNFAGEASFKNTLQDFDEQYSTLAKAAANTIGYQTPDLGRGNVQRFLNTYAVGDETGYLWRSEHEDVNTATAIYCTYFGKYYGTDHPSVMVNLIDQENINGLVLEEAASTATNVDILGYDIEQATSGTWERVSNLTEVNPGAYSGYLSYRLITANVGPQPCLSSIFSSGGQNFVQECGGKLQIPTISPNSVVTALSGTTAGSVYWSQPFQGTAYKKAILNFQAYENSTSTPQTITFPTAFSYTPTSVGDCPSGMSVSTMTTTLPVSMSAAFTGQCIVEGQ